MLCVHHTISTYHAAPADVETSAIVLNIHGVKIAGFPVEELEDVNKLRAHVYVVLVQFTLTMYGVKISGFPV
jgi:hypothetical protein